MPFKAILLLSFLLASLQLNAQEGSLGRLFSTPEERASLNRARDALFEEQNLEELLSEDLAAEIAEPVYEQQSVVQFGGIVRQANGSHTLWLNGVPVRDSELPPYLRLDVSGALAVLHVNLANQDFSLKPGQTLDAEEGRVREAYEISPEQVLAINAEVVARAGRMRAIAERSSRRTAAVVDGDAAGGDQAAIPSEEEALVQSVLEGMRLMQQLQEAQP
jgi:hypothetical protein